MQTGDQTSRRQEQAPLKHMPQLDGLRALAVTAVFIHHTPLGGWMPVPLGGLGVRLFFVLSGYLITGILLKCRKAIDQGTIGKAYGIRQFYIRRFLRIFPLYYSVILCCLVVDFGGAREMYPWLLTYTTNIQLSLLGKWHSFSHFWSLAVEEHFYLVWPWVVFFAPRRFLAPLMQLTILCGPLYRWYAVAHGFNEIAIDCFTCSCLDSLGLGALLAILQQPWCRSPLRHLVSRNVLLTVSWGAVLILYVSAFFDRMWVLGTIMQDVFIGILFVCLMEHAAVGYEGVMGGILESKPIVYIGKISYGIYVYHAFIPYLMDWAWRTAGWGKPRLGWAGWILDAFVTVGIASLSWHLFELPMNRLKRHFTYFSAKGGAS